MPWGSWEVCVLSWLYQAVLCVPGWSLNLYVLPAPLGKALHLEESLRGLRKKEWSILSDPDGGKEAASCPGLR